MSKTDLFKSDKTYYSAKATPSLIEVPELPYLTLDGKGDPSQSEFSKNIEALYTTAYKLKFQYKAAGKDFAVSKLEALWWYDEKKYRGVTVTDAPVKIPRSAWEYTLMIRLPDFVTSSEVELAKKIAFEKKGLAPIQRIIFRYIHEGKAVQVLHTGPFDTEPVSLGKLMEYMTANNLDRNGYHHEIYVSDFRKTKPEKLKTILREPVRQTI